MRLNTLFTLSRNSTLVGTDLIAPASSSRARGFAQVIALIESLSSLNSQDAGKHEADIQQALTSLAAQQPISLELHGKLAKATLQAGATAAAMQTATALLAAALPHGRAFQDVVDPADAPGVATGDWQWLAVGSLVLGQVNLILLCASQASDHPSSTSKCVAPQCLSATCCHACRQSCSATKVALHLNYQPVRSS